MKIIQDLVLFSVLLLASMLWPQAPSTPKKASPEKQAAILKLQLQATRIQASYNSCQQTDFQGQFNAASLQIQKEKDEALKEAGLDSKTWDLNFDTFEFVNKTPTPPPSPAPAKKEEPKPAPAEKKP